MSIKVRYVDAFKVKQYERIEEVKDVIILELHDIPHER